MDTIGNICSLLEDKKALMQAYETATLAMLNCPAEDVEHYIMERDKLATEAETLDGRIARLADAEPNGALLVDAAYARVDFDHVPSEYHCIFYAGQAVRGIGSRIAESNKQVMERLQALRQEALEGIRQNQNLPKIKKYLTDLADVPAKGQPGRKV